MNRRLKKLCGFLAVAAIATVMVVVFCQRRGTSEVVRTVAERGTLQTDAHATRVAQRPKEKRKSPRGPGVRPVPHGGLVGETLDCREILLPPGTNGVKRFRREFVFRPAGRADALRIDESYEGDNSQPRFLGSAEYAASHMMVTLDGQTDFAAFCEKMSAAGLAVEGPVMTFGSKGGAKLAIVHSRDETVNALEQIEATVAKCEPSARICRDPILQAFADEARYPEEAANQPEGCWWIDKINAPAAWAHQVSATNEVIAVIDCGCTITHEDLAANIWCNPLEIPDNGIDDDGNGIVDDCHGATFYGSSSDRWAGTATGFYQLAGKIESRSSGLCGDGWDACIPRPSTNGYAFAGGGTNDTGWASREGWGHGTHCAGIVGAVGDNGVGVCGALWTARIMALRYAAPVIDVLIESPKRYWWGKPKGTMSDAIKCMHYAVLHGAKILSFSSGVQLTNAVNVAATSSAYEQAFSDVLDEIACSNAILVCAAGNTSKKELQNVDTLPMFPACLKSDNIVSVANLAANDELYNSSCYGSRSVDIAAPGVDILSTYVSIAGGVQTNLYGLLTGTSQATPMVAGCLALVKAAFPGETYAETINRLFAASDKLPSLEGKVKTGGRLNVGNVFANACAAPYGVTASRGEFDDRIAVSWKSTKGAYARVWRADAATGELQPVSGWMKAKSFADYDVECDRTYAYAVQVSQKPDGRQASMLSERVTGYAEDKSLDAWDPADDTADGATELARENPEHRLSKRDQADWYRMRLEYGRTYDFGALIMDGGGVSLELSRNGERVASRTGELTYTVMAREAAGDCFLCVTPSDGLASRQVIRYRVSCRVTGGYDAWDEDGRDDVPAGAHALIGPDETVRQVQALSLCDCDLADWFKFELEKDYEYVFRTGNGGVRAQLFAESGLTAPVAETGADGALRFVPDVSGAYYLKLSRVGDKGIFAYALEYVRNSSEFGFQFTPGEFLELVEPDGADWPGNPFLTTNESEVTAFSALTTKDRGIVRWAFNEDLLLDVGEGVHITNLVEVCSIDGQRLMWGYAVWEGSLDWTIVDFKTHLPELPVGSYFVRLTLNCDVNGHAAYRETGLADNVRELAFTVTETAEAPDGLTIEGPARIAGGEEAEYRCIADYPNGRTAEIAADWAVVSGGDAVRCEMRNGRFHVLGLGAAGEASVVLRVTQGGMAAERTVTLVREREPRLSAFVSPTYRPDGEMAIAAGLLRFKGVCAEAGDQVAAFAVMSDGSLECRAQAFVDADGAFALRIPLMAEGEIVVFRAYDASAGDGGLTFDCLQALPAHFNVSLGSDEDPFVVDAVGGDPFGTPQPGGRSTEFVAMVTVGGKAAGAGDILAFFDGDRLVGKQLVTFDAVEGLDEVRSAADCRLYLNEGLRSLSVAVWDSGSGRLFRCPEPLQVTAGTTLSAPVRLDAQPAETETYSEEGGVPILLTAEPGEPGVTHTVTFDLADGADRIGGGELVQTVADGASAEPPEIACRAGRVFRFWNYPANNVRADRTITACYETATRSAPAQVDFAWLDRRLGPGSHTLAEYEAAALAPTGKTGADGQPLAAWEEYLAGTDPDDPDDVFRATIEVVGGVPQVGWSPNLNSNGVSRLYTVWGKANLDDEDWTTPPAADARFFKVTVDEP